MARDFYDHFEVCREIFSKASRISGYDLTHICFEENEKLHQTRYTQPALLTASCAILAVLQEAGLHADMTAGLSLGEYCALVAAKALTFEDAIRIVCQRGIYMEEAVPEGEGCMMAILSRKPLPVEAVCEEVDGIVSVANYNCPGQQVITGEKKAVEQAAERLLSAGALRSVPLKVSGPFHSAMLADAGKKLGELLKTVAICQPEIPFVSNVTAQEAENPEELKTLLGQQVCASVRWQQSVEYMIQNGVDTIIEIGPGTTLSGFTKKIDRSIQMLHVEKPEDMDAIKEKIMNG
jgi:[acyl-carrier-protein] S-malonyltransferase